MTDRFRILILEDDARRTAAMRERLEERFGQYETVVLPDASAFITAFRESPNRVLAISLDHDLEPHEENSLDPGTGRQVADFLAEYYTPDPSLMIHVLLERTRIMIHSTNTLAADGMERVLRDAGLRVSRITPYGDLEWVSEAWFPAFRKLILSAVSTIDYVYKITAHIELPPINNRVNCYKEWLKQLRGADATRKILDDYIQQNRFLTHSPIEPELLEPPELEEQLFLLKRAFLLKQLAGHPSVPPADSGEDTSHK